MKAQLTKPTLFILAGTLIVFGLLLPVFSYAGVSVGYYYGGHHGYSRHNYGGYGRHGYYGHHGYGYGYNRHRAYSYYPRHHYGSRSYYSPYKSYQHYPNPSYSAPAGSNNNQHTNNKYTGTESTAWDILSKGQASSALTIFAKEAENNPKAGIPKVGYSLAAASSGNLSTGVWAMRKAFRVDPDSLHYLQLDEAGLHVINILIDKYQYSLKQEDNFLNEAFMVSALNYLKHDYIASLEAVDHAIKNGDENTSVHNLQRLINQQLANDKKL